MEILPLALENRAQIDEHIREEWGGPIIVSLGNAYRSDVLPGFVAIEGGEVAGALLYRMEGNACEIAVLFALQPSRGVGRALLDTAIANARAQGAARVWLVTTNDNTPAIRFYQKYGMALAAVHIGSFEATRRIKGNLPALGLDGIPIEHEFEFEMIL
jgi:ribosomal protein S18 acetylase RimI-like enzyme